MKKILSSFLVVSLLNFLFIGCGKNSFTVYIQLQCDDEIYAVHVEYYIGETAIGGTEASLTPEKDVAFESGATVSFAFSAEDFPQDAQIKDFRFEVYLLLADGNEIVAASLGIAARYGESYHYSLYGNEEEGFRLQRGGE